MKNQILIILSFVFIVFAGSLTSADIIDTITPIYTPIYTPIDTSIYNPIYTPAHNPIDISIYEPINVPISPLVVSTYDPIYNPVLPQPIISPVVPNLPDIPNIPEIIPIPPYIPYIPPVIPDVPYIPPETYYIEPITWIDPLDFIDIVSVVKPARIIEIPKITEPINVIEIPEIFQPVDITNLLNITPDISEPVHIYSQDIPTSNEIADFVADVYLHQEPVWIDTVELIGSFDAFPPVITIDIPPIVEPIETIVPIEVTDMDTDTIQRVIDSIKATENIRKIELAEILEPLDWSKLISPYVPAPRIIIWEPVVYVVPIPDLNIWKLVVVPKYIGILIRDKTWYVDFLHGSNRNDGLSPTTAFKTIQKAINMSEDGDVINVLPGVYKESVIFSGKEITVQSAGDAAILESLDQIAISFYDNSVLRNFIVRNSFIGILIANSSPVIHNVTIVGNEYGIESYRDSSPSIMNSILWYNNESDLYECQATYSCIERLDDGEGNISKDPLFVDFENGDYHLQSSRGRYWAEHNVWVLDSVDSPCIDAGYPEAIYSQERMPNGSQINIGAFGGTAYASMSELPVSADFNGDGIVDCNDLE